MRVIFMGTPAFAVPTLQCLIDMPAPSTGSPRLRSGQAGRAADIVAVVTQPDRPVGRGRRVQMSPVKELALAHGLPVLQPASLRAPEAVSELASYQPDVVVVAAFGQILRPAVLDLPPLGCLNVHASLLPRWRGAAPIAAVLLAGDAATGVTIMRMDAGMDTGSILAQAAVPIHDADTAIELSGRLAERGADLLAETLPRWARGEMAARSQPEAGITTAPQIRKEDGRADWALPAVELWRRWRAYQPWPGLYTDCQGRNLKLVRVQPLSGWRGHAAPGCVVSVPQGIAVATGQGALLLEEVQLAGKRAMSTADFCCGQQEFVGSSLCAPPLAG
ncbi:MAG: methionyl-tRNA formyltransferase [Chloroflexi bacterium]|nr:methionyl-tRNA formyltransferase [Chloroflexota bacterium]MBU1751481.1 methionyl-tRNA formyltransferase [Chloroflexota bacterium]